MFFNIEEAKETILDFSQGAMKGLQFYFVFNTISLQITRYVTLNIKLSNLQLNQLKSGIKNGTEVTLDSLSNTVGESNDKNNVLHKLLLTNTQVSKLCKAFANGSSANIKLSKTQLHSVRRIGPLDYY